MKRDFQYKENFNKYREDRKFAMNSRVHFYGSSLGEARTVEYVNYSDQRERN